MGLSTTGPALSPVASLCLLCEPSQKGNLLDAKQRHSAVTRFSAITLCSAAAALGATAWQHAHAAHLRLRAHL